VSLLGFSRSVTDNAHVHQPWSVKTRCALSASRSNF